MSRPPREKRLERQRLDQGDPNDTVGRSKGGSHRNLYYHEPGCYHLERADSVKWITRAEAKDRWLAPCQNCVDLIS